MREQSIPVVILGAGGYSRLCYEILRSRPELNIIGCTDKAMGLSEQSLADGQVLHVLGDDDMLPQLASEYPDLHAVLALGPNLMPARRRLVAQIEALGIKPIGGVHASAYVSPMASVGAGTVVGAGCLLSAGVQIGEHCALVVGASFDHDTFLGNNVLIGQGARISSYVEIGDEVVVEMGADINDRVIIGRGARILSGSFVNTDVPENAVVFGLPARVVRYTAD